MGNRERLLIDWALEQGFDRAGVTPLGPSSRGDELRAWLTAGHQAGMEWMGRRTERRRDPRRLLDGARAALCVALQYHPLPGGDDVAGDLWGRVARYARGDDYHLIMEEGLRRLAHRIESAFPGSRSRYYVDTGPILERELAARAGLGSVGKNTNLLHPEAGSWFLIGEILLTLRVEPPAVYEDLCGTCTACLDACPTGALPEPYRLDSRRCISYWTIEHRGAIPKAMRDRLGGWVFGCDICQEVCPLNEQSLGATEKRLELPRQRADVDLTALVEMSRNEYVERFRRSPMKRAKLEGLQRNATLAMGHRRERRYVRPLRRLLTSGKDAVARSHAAWSLGRIGGARARRALNDASETERDAVVKGEILSALEDLAGDRSP